ncbi:MAG: SusF/SusE family outer membrane protein [Bacteroidales bacterium]|nr:SusF/SusE family outer membrane protein [Bacteroidales bacterium]
MKNISKYGLMTLLAIAMIFVACTKEEEDVRLDPQLSTMRVTGIGSDSAVIVGFVIAEGDGFTEKGVCYDVTNDPTIESNKVTYADTLEDAAYNVVLHGLDYATTYYVRAYALNGTTPVYGDTLSFTTKPVVPTLTTTEITSITGNSAATGGNVTIAGGADVTAYGVCYGTDENPSVDGDKTEDGSGTGAFTSELNGLKGNTTYYVRAYATNSAGTGYGTQVSFTTLVDLPAITTAAATEITKTSAVSGGHLSYDGGGTITEKGIVWAITENPTTADNSIADISTDTGTFVANITGLELSTTYHVRAYATNSAGTAYGENISFTTLADITTFWVVGGYNGWDNSDNAEYIISTESSEGEAEGYVYLTAGEIKLTTDHSWDDAHTFGDDGTGGLTNPGGNIAVAEDGYYRIRANLANMTYSLVKTVWGVIGDATPSGWDDDTELSYDADSKTWIGGMKLLETGEFKFRGKDDWSINYGGDLNALVHDGGNFASPGVEADYAFTLDLSTPNEYKAAVNRWGIIGEATPGGWDADTDMTWDAGNGVFTLTADLTAAEMKFRANDDWAINLGGDLGALTQDGANISISEAGNYTITLNPWTGVATFTKN